jgi:hypothetical protein
MVVRKAYSVFEEILIDLASDIRALAQHPDSRGLTDRRPFRASPTGPLSCLFTSYGHLDLAHKTRIERVLRSRLIDRAGQDVGEKWQSLSKIEQENARQASHLHKADERWLNIYYCQKHDPLKRFQYVRGKSTNQPGN